MIPTTPPVVTLLDLLPADVWGVVGRFVEARGLAAAGCRTLYDAVRGGAGPRGAPVVRFAITTVQLTG